MKIFIFCLAFVTSLSAQENIDRNFQKFLDNHQYTSRGILQYENIFGNEFISTGGLETTKVFVSMLDLKPGQHVLDVGCGIGGSAFYMAEKYGVEVLGVDLSSNMIQIARERSKCSPASITFEVVDITKVEYPSELFDVIYSCDALLHIADKPVLFDKFLSWLKPGGVLLISDYCCGVGAHSEEFKAYVKNRQYHLLDPYTYGKALETAGFVDVIAEDRTCQFVNVLKRELTKAERIKKEFVRGFSNEDYDHIVEGWKAKVKRCGAGYQKWGLFRARKGISMATAD